MPIHAKLNEDQCPISEELLGEMHQSAPGHAVDIANDLPEPQRARLAAFCYNRRHLHQLALSIASTCDKQHLEAAAGSLGGVMYHQSRSIDLSSELDHLTSRSYTKPVSLADRLNLDMLDED